MSEDTLNEKLKKAIIDNMQASHFSQEQRAANECEKICISEMVYLIDRLVSAKDINELHSNFKAERISLTNKLNSLK